MADSSLKLLPGFRFHPTDEEIISDYLVPKTLNPSYTTPVMGEVDLNNVEPGNLPSKAKMGEKEWYFFCHQGKKYPTGTRIDRSTKAGFWKATGKDRDIFNGEKVLVGKRKTLVFYTGRAPGGVKTKWVMKEFRIEGSPYPNLPSENEWVVSKVSYKGPIEERERIKSIVQQLVLDSDPMPALMDVSFNSVESQVSHKGPMDGKDIVKQIVQQLVPGSTTMPSLMDVSNFNSVESQVYHNGLTTGRENMTSIVDTSDFKSIESMISHKRLMTTTDGMEKMQSIVQLPVPDLVTMPAPMDIPDINSGNSGCPESGWVNVVEANIKYISSSYGYGATVHPHTYDPNVDDEDLELIRAMSTFDAESEREIGRHTNGDPVWNPKMIVCASKDAGGTSRDWSLDDWWKLKENEMGCYDVEDLDDLSKM